MEAASEALIAFSLSWIGLSLLGSDVVSSTMMSQGWGTGFTGVGDRGRKGGRRHLRDERHMA